MHVKNEDFSVINFCGKVKSSSFCHISSFLLIIIVSKMLHTELWSNIVRNENIITKCVNSYYKVRQLFFITKCVNAYYKVRQLFYYKVCQLLQSVSAHVLQSVSGITKCVVITKCVRTSRTYRKVERV